MPTPRLGLFLLCGFLLLAEGAFADFATGSGHVEWTFDLLEANQPVSISAPTCEGE